MKRQINLTLLFLFVLFSLVLTGCASSASSYQVQSQLNCQSATGQNTTCSVTLTSASSSTGDFNWTPSSSPDGAQFSPSSGSVAPGTSSDVINVTMVPDICPFTLIFTGSDGFYVSSEVNNC